MKKILVLATLAMLSFGGFVGYTTNYTNIVQAHEPTIPRFIDVPRTNGFNLDINLNKGIVACNSTEQDIEVNIQRKDSIVYLTSVVEKEIPVYIERRQSFPLRKRKPNVVEVCNWETNPKRIMR